MENTKQQSGAIDPRPLIAVVNDDEDILAMFDLALTEAGYQPLLIRQGEEAASMIRHAQPALLIQDIWMERIDTGVRLLHALHDDDATRTLPVIVCSAHPFMRPELADLLREPHYMFLQKPFPLDDLLSAIPTMLCSPAASRAAGQQGA
jgi:DNA-binding NtrC family response regulator